MHNMDTSQGSAKAVLRSEAFSRGYQEARKGLPPASDAFPLSTVWLYERGRQFAFCYDGRLKEGNRVRMDALYALGGAMNAGHVL